MNLEQLERFSAKVCRAHGGVDPISQMNNVEYCYLDALHMVKGECSLEELTRRLGRGRAVIETDIKALYQKRYLNISEQGGVYITELGKQQLANEQRVHALMALEMTANISDEDAHFLDTVLHRSR